MLSYPAKNTVIATIPVGSNPYFVAVTHNGAYAYVTNYGSNSVSVINITTNAVITASPSPKLTSTPTLLPTLTPSVPEFNHLQFLCCLV